MGELWIRIKLWTKVTVFGLILLYVLIFTAKNSGPEVDLWVWFGKNPHMSVLLLALYAFVAGGLVTMLSLTTLRTVRQVRQAVTRGRQARDERQMAQMKEKADRLVGKPAVDPAPAATPEP